ncbi:sodium-dependent proline transporter-like protein [Aphelenchoides avenae]|nr:sodium-dependent proline transporter-like protein [Aphelenchus avenae]
MKLFVTAADWKGLMHMQPWSDAIAHVLFSLSLGDGSILKIASHNQFNNNVLYDVMFATVADFVVSVIGGVSFFASIRDLKPPLDQGGTP